MNLSWPIHYIALIPPKNAARKQVQNHDYSSRPRTEMEVWNEEMFSFRFTGSSLSRNTSSPVCDGDVTTYVEAASADATMTNKWANAYKDVLLCRLHLQIYILGEYQ